MLLFLLGYLQLYDSMGHSGKFSVCLNGDSLEIFKSVDFLKCFWLIKIISGVIVNLIVSPIPWLFFAGAPLVNLLGQRSALIRPILKSPGGHVRNFVYKFANFRWAVGWGGLAAETRRPFSTTLSKIYIDQQNEERLTNNEMNENI